MAAAKERAVWSVARTAPLADAEERAVVRCEQSCGRRYEVPSEAGAQFCWESASGGSQGSVIVPLLARAANSARRT